MEEEKLTQDLFKMFELIRKENEKKKKKKKKPDKRFTIFF